MNLLINSLCLFILSVLSVSSALADCGEGSLFALNPNQTYAAIKTREENPRILFWKIETGKATQLSDPDMYVQELYFIDDNHLLAVGSKKSYGPLYKVWNINTGTLVTFQNKILKDFSDAKTNFSKNKRYAITSSQLAFGGWSYMVVDLTTGKDIYNVKLSKGQGQISDDGKTFYYTENYTKKSWDGKDSPLEWVKLHTVDIATNKKTFSIPLNTMASDYSSLGWAQESLVLYDASAIVFNTKTNQINNPPYVGPILDWSDDFSVRVSGDRQDPYEFKIAGIKPKGVISFYPGDSKSVVKLSSDNKKVAMISYFAEVTFFDITTLSKTTAPTCQE